MDREQHLLLTISKILDLPVLGDFPPLAYLRKESSVLPVERLKELVRFDEEHVAGVVADRKKNTLFARRESSEFLIAQFEREDRRVKTLKNVPDLQ